MIYLGSCCIDFHKVVIMFYHCSCNILSTSSCYPPEIERKIQFDPDTEKTFWYHFLYPHLTSKLKYEFPLQFALQQ